MMKKTARVQNPLTIIAIFAGLSEISMAYVLPRISSELQPIFMWFVMLFPLFLVIAFFATLNWNPKVLYAPSDYREEEHFLQTMGINPSENGQRLDTMVVHEPSTEHPTTQDGDASQATPVFPTQEQSRVNALLAEDLVLRKLEIEYAVPFRRQASLTPDAIKGRFHGFATTQDDQLIVVQIKLFRTILFDAKELANKIADVHSNISHFMHSKNVTMVHFTLILAVVADIPNDQFEDFQRRAEDIKKHSNLKCQLLVLHFEELKRQFGIVS